MKRLFPFLLIAINFLCYSAHADEKPIYAPTVTNEVLLQKTCAPFLEMSEAELLALVPPQPGFWQCGSPGSARGAQERNLIWNLSLGDKVQDKYSKELFPSAQYPENATVSVKTPTGKTQIFKVYEDKDGKKYWFEGRRWYEQRTLLEKAAYQLAQLYRINPAKYQEAGKRSAAILTRFADVYPDYIPRYDFPYRDKKFYSLDTDFLHLPEGAYRGARWYWTALGDISRDLLLAYDQLAGSTFLDVKARTHIEKDLLGGMVDFVNLYHGSALGNLTVPMWRSQAIAATILKRPALKEQVMQDMHTMLTTQFFDDGFWYENTVSYHLQVIRGFRQVLMALNPDLKEADLDSFLATNYPHLVLPMTAANALRLPNGTYAAINDTWASETYAPPITESKAQLLPGMGYGVLGFGKGADQLQAHLKYSGRYGHHHYDSLNLLLFADGKELSSDVGYTHTKARGWATSTAAHNTVVIDGKNQLRHDVVDDALGNLLLFNGEDSGFQAIEVAAPGTYGKAISDYRRALITVRNASGITYVVDIFHVAGGAQHDWMLHGSADEAQQLQLDAPDGNALSLQTATDLVPPNFHFQEPQNEFDTKLLPQNYWAYGHLKNVHETQTSNTIKATFANSNHSGLQSWIVGGAKSTFYTAQSWNIRGARENRGESTVEDQSKLDVHLRQDLIVRRRGPENQFIAVHVPFDKTPAVTNVTQLAWPQKGILLKIEFTGGVDYVIYQPDTTLRSGIIDSTQTQFDGRIALIHCGKTSSLKMIGGSQLRFGKEGIKSTFAKAPLISARDNTLTVQGKFPIANGNVIIIQHGDHRTSAFHVESSRWDGKSTFITTRESPALELSANDILKIQTFPHSEFKGPHWVTVNSLTASS